VTILVKMVWSAVEPKETGEDPGVGSAVIGVEVAPAHPLSGHPAHTAHAGDQTRARILSVALELIADRGFAATSTREIAERLGFTKAALYYHFRTKDDLLAAILGPAMAELGALVERGRGARTPEERRDLVEGYVDIVERHADLIRVLASDPSVKESAGLHTAMPVFRQLIPVLSGNDDPDTAQRTRVRAALTAVHGALVHAQPDDDPEVVRSTAFEAACAVLGLPGPHPNKRKAQPR
jgi:AcrR family transcriptional regulator